MRLLDYETNAFALLQTGCFPQFVCPVDPLPFESRLVSTEVAITCGLFVNGLEKVEILNDGLGP
jgi:hypothetical protein